MRELATRVWLCVRCCCEASALAIDPYVLTQHFLQKVTKVYGRTLAYIKNEVDLSYPTVQRAVKKMVDKMRVGSNQNILRIHWEFSSSTNALSFNPKQQRRSFLVEPVEEMQTKRLTKTEQLIKISAMSIRNGTYF